MARKTSTKAIANTVNAGTDGSVELQQSSVVGRSNQHRALSIKQAYETVSTLRKAVNAKAADTAKAKLRFFSRSTNSEITAGPVVDLFRKPNNYTSTSRMVYDLCAWRTLTGEMAVLPFDRAATSKEQRYSGTALTPTGMMILDPFSLQHYPDNACDPDELTSWGYYLPGGMMVKGITADRLAFARNFSPVSRVRGMSELLAGVTEASTNYFVNRYNASFFRNGCSADMMLVFPKGTRKQAMEDACERFRHDHGIWNDKGFSLVAVAAEGVKVEQLQQTSKQGSFLDLSQYNDERIAALVGVPASVMGFYSKTRFDTIDSELEAYAENTIVPELVTISEFLQTQIVDRYFKRGAKSEKKDIGHMSKLTKGLFTRAMDENAQSEVVVMLDPDSLPIMSRLNQQRVEQAGKLRDLLDLSANEAAEYVGIELPKNPLRDQIWVPNLRMRIDGPSPEAQFNPQPDPVAPAPADNADTTDDGEPQADKAAVAGLKKSVREYRAMLLAAVSEGRMFDRSAALRLFTDNKAASLQVHRDVVAVSALIKREGAVEEKVAEVKAWMNRTFTQRKLKGWAKGN